MIYLLCKYDKTINKITSTLTLKHGECLDVCRVLGSVRFAAKQVLLLLVCGEFTAVTRRVICCRRDQRQPVLVLFQFLLT